MFKAATVTTKEPFSRDVGRRLGGALVENLGESPNACWLFSAPGQRLRDLVLGVNDVTHPGLVIGCTTDGEISSSGFSTGSAVLAGIATDQIDFHVAAVEGLRRDSQ